MAVWVHGLRSPALWVLAGCSVAEATAIVKVVTKAADEACAAAVLQRESEAVPSLWQQLPILCTACYRKSQGNDK